MKKQFALLLLFLVCVLSPSSAYAARNVIISSDKSSISINDELNISASLSGFTNGEKVYIKGAFFKDGSSNYFGLTKSNDSWIKNSTTALSQREVIIGNWDNLIAVKPDYSDSGFAGSGSYKFKLGFYYLTSGGNASSVNWSANNLDISLDSPPSQPPTTAPTKASTTSISTKSVATVSKTPTPKSVSPVVSKSANVVVVSNNNAKFAKISDTRPASEFAKIKPITNLSPTEKKEVRVLGANTSDFSPVLFLAGGLFLVLGAGWFVFRELKERRIL